MKLIVLFHVLILSSAILVAQNAPQAHFAAASNQICDSVYTESFTDQSTNNPTSWQWFFPGATPDTSSLKNPTNIIYKGYGCYNVKLVVKNHYGSDSLSDSNCICLDAPPNVTLTGKFTACIVAQKSDTIVAHGGSRYYWMNGDTTPYIVFPDGGGPILYFQVKVYNGACYKDSTFYIVSDSLPVFTFKGDTSICEGSSTTISAISRTTYKCKYLWNTGSTTDSIVVKGIQAGEYTYKLTITKGGCIDSSKIKVGVHDCTGIEDYNDPLNKVEIYPSPSTGSFNLTFSNLSTAYRVDIYNMLGKKIYTQALPQNQSNSTINIVGQPDGVYLYRVLSEGGGLIGEGKVVVEK